MSHLVPYTTNTSFIYPRMPSISECYQMFSVYSENICTLKPIHIIDMNKEKNTEWTKHHFIVSYMWGHFSVNWNHFGVSIEFRGIDIYTPKPIISTEKRPRLKIKLFSQLITKGASRHRHSFEIDEKVHFNFRPLYRAINCDALNESKKMAFLLKFKITFSLFTKQLSHTILFPPFSTKSGLSSLFYIYILEKLSISLFLLKC